MPKHVGGEFVPLLCTYSSAGTLDLYASQCTRGIKIVGLS